MTIPSSGPISFSQINAELRRGTTASYSLNESKVRILASVGFTGVQTNNNTRIPFSSLRGHTWAETTITGDTLNYVYSSPTPGKTYGVLTINAGVRIGSSTPATAALIVQGGNGDSLVIVNNGKILGAGGAGGQYGGGGGGNGGDAINLQGQGIFCDLQNTNGVIGGGGGGGAGGPGRMDNQRSQPTYINGVSGGTGAGYVPGAAGAVSGQYYGHVDGGIGQSGGSDGNQFAGGSAGYIDYYGPNSFGQRGGTLGETISGAGGRSIVNISRLVSYAIGGTTYGATV